MSYSSTVFLNGVNLLYGKARKTSTTQDTRQPTQYGIKREEQIDPISP